MEAMARSVRSTYHSTQMKTSLLCIALAAGALPEFLEMLIFTMEAKGLPIDKGVRGQTPLLMALESRNMAKIRLVGTSFCEICHLDILLHSELKTGITGTDISKIEDAPSNLYSPQVIHMSHVSKIYFISIESARYGVMTLCSYI